MCRSFLIDASLLSLTLRPSSSAFSARMQHIRWRNLFTCRRAKLRHQAGARA
jgi:hypothetical protein